MVQIKASSTPKKDEGDVQPVTPQRRASTSSRKIATPRAEGVSTTPLRRSARVAGKSPEIVTSPLKSELSSNAHAKSAPTFEALKLWTSSRAWAFFIWFAAITMLLSVGFFVSTRFDLPRVFEQWRRSLSSPLKSTAKGV